MEKQENLESLIGKFGFLYWNFLFFIKGMEENLGKEEFLVFYQEDLIWSFKGFGWDLKVIQEEIELDFGNRLLGKFIIVLSFDILELWSVRIFYEELKGVRFL